MDLSTSVPNAGLGDLCGFADTSERLHYTPEHVANLVDVCIQHHPAQTIRKNQFASYAMPEQHLQPSIVSIPFPYVQVNGDNPQMYQDATVYMDNIMRNVNRDSEDARQSNPGSSSASNTSAEADQPRAAHQMIITTTDDNSTIRPAHPLATPVISEKQFDHLSDQPMDLSVRRAKRKLSADNELEVAYKRRNREVFQRKEVAQLEKKTVAAPYTGYAPSAMTLPTGSGDNSGGVNHSFNEAVASVQNRANLDRARQCATSNGIQPGEFAKNYGAQYTPYFDVNTRYNYNVSNNNVAIAEPGEIRPNVNYTIRHAPCGLSPFPVSLPMNSATNSLQFCTDQRTHNTTGYTLENNASLVNTNFNMMDVCNSGGDRSTSTSTQVNYHKNKVNNVHGDNMIKMTPVYTNIQPTRPTPLLTQILNGSPTHVFKELNRPMTDKLKRLMEDEVNTVTMTMPVNRQFINPQAAPIAAPQCFIPQNYPGVGPAPSFTNNVGYVTPAMFGNGLLQPLPPHGVHPVLQHNDGLVRELNQSSVSVGRNRFIPAPPNVGVPVQAPPTMNAQYSQSPTTHPSSALFTDFTRRYFAGLRTVKPQSQFTSASTTRAKRLVPRFLSRGFENRSPDMKLAAMIRDYDVERDYSTVTVEDDSESPPPPPPPTSSSVASGSVTADTIVGDVVEEAASVDDVPEKDGDEESKKPTLNTESESNARN